MRSGSSKDRRTISRFETYFESILEIEKKSSDCSPFLASRRAGGDGRNIFSRKRKIGAHARLLLDVADIQDAKPIERQYCCPDTRQFFFNRRNRSDICNGQFRPGIRWIRQRSTIQLTVWRNGQRF